MPKLLSQLFIPIFLLSCLTLFNVNFLILLALSIPTFSIVVFSPENFLFPITWQTIQWFKSH